MTQPSWDEFEKVTTLVGDIACLDASGGAREERLLAGVSQLLGARMGFLLRSEFTNHGPAPHRLISCHDHGLSQRESRLMLAYMAENGQDDPTIKPSMAPVREALPGTTFAVLRKELVPDSVFYRHPHFDFCAEIDTDSRLILSTRLEGSRMIALSLHRPRGDRSFGEHERRLGGVLFEQAVRLLGWPSVPVGGFLRATNGDMIDLTQAGPTFEDLAETFEFTQREREIARWVARGLANKEIAAELQISPQTVKRHLSNLFRKARVESRTELAYRLTPN